MNNRMQGALAMIVRRRVPEDLDLWPRIAAGLNERKSLMQIIRTRPLLIVIAAVIVLLLLTGVAYAIGNVLGYIPGVGFVQPGSLRILAEPVTQARAGVTVTIEQVVADSERTV